MEMRELLTRRFGESPATPVAQTAADHWLSGVLGRASCRRYTGEAVPEALLQTLFSAAFSAPSKSDLQQASVIRITDRALQARIAGHCAHTEWLAAAPVFMVWCGDGRRIRRLAEWRGHPFANDHLDAFMNAAVDAGIAMQTFILAAEAAGLGCCPVSEIRDAIEPLAEALALPDGVFPVAGLCVGWPGEHPAVSMRLPLAVTVHRDRYDDRDLLSAVADYDRRREAAAPTAPGQQRDVARFGVSAEYGWSEHRTRQYARPVRDDFGRFVRARGFSLE